MDVDMDFSMVDTDPDLTAVHLQFVQHLAHKLEGLKIQPRVFPTMTLPTILDTCEGSSNCYIDNFPWEFQLELLFRNYNSFAANFYGARSIQARKQKANMNIAHAT
ncbi:hypothetical protein E8E11_005971 [Didymella keratinophila]|nr:hypothetical protein E8E11_005971 [Didymella keratinophila]